MSPLQISFERKDSEKSKLPTRRSSRISRLRLSSEPDTNEKHSEKPNSISEKLNKKKDGAAGSAEEVAVITNDRRVDNSSMSSLLISPEDNINTVDKSCMSTLQVSTKTGSSGSKSMSNNKKSFSNSDPSVMSSLHQSSEMAPSNLVRQSKEGSSKASFSSLNDSGSENVKNIIQTVIENLQTPEPVIGRKKSDEAPASSSTSSINSNDSEIVSPKKNVIGTMNRQTADDYLADKSYDQVNTKITRQVSTRSKVKKIHPTNTSNIRTSESETDQSLNNRTNSDNSSDSTKSKRRLRKLYNPDDSIHILIDDEKEREEVRTRARKRKSEEGVFINPAEILKSSDRRSEKTSLIDSLDWNSSENFTKTNQK